MIGHPQLQPTTATICFLILITKLEQALRPRGGAIESGHHKKQNSGAQKIYFFMEQKIVRNIKRHKKIKIRSTSLNLIKSYLQFKYVITGIEWIVHNIN